MNSPLAQQIRRRPDLWVGIAIVAIALLVFGRNLAAQFVRWDDLDMIVGNALLRPPQWVRLWAKPTFGLYTPLAYTVQAGLTSLSWAVAGGLKPVFFHAANLLMHAVAVFACWRWLATLTKDRLAAAIGAAVLLVHPVVVEPVAWAASFNTTLASALGMIALMLAASERRHWRRFLLATVFFILALLAKPSVCGLPLALLAVDRLLRRIVWREALVRAAIWAAIVVPFLLIGRAAQKAVDIDVPPLAMRGVIALDSCGFYLLHWIAPVGFAIDYGHIPEHVGANAGTALRISVTLAIAAVAIWQVRRRPFVAAAGLVVLAAAGPVLGLITFDFQYYSTVADRYVYLSTAGVAMAIAFALRGQVMRRPVALASGAILAGLAALSFVQAGTWHDTFALLNQAMAVNPDSVAAHETLGFEMAQRAADPTTPPDQRNEFGRQAFALYDRALQLRPRSARTHFNLGNLLFKTGHPDQAVAQYAIAGQALGDDIRLQNNWGIACWQLHDADSAIAHFDRALAVEPTNPDTYANKAAVLMHTNRAVEAAELCREALKLQPGHPQATRLLQQLQAG